MVEKIRKLITYSDDKLSLERFICYLEQFDSWFMHAKNIEYKPIIDELPEIALVAIPRDMVQVEIYLHQHTMSNEQLEYAISEGFRFNKRIVLTQFNLSSAAIKSVVQINDSVELYKLEYPSLNRTTAYFQVASDKELLQCIAGFEGSFQN